MTYLSRFGNMTVVDEAVYKSEISSGVGYVASLYSQTSDSPTVTNTTTETSIIGNGVGTLTIPANTYKVGNTYTVKMCGVLSSQNNHTIRIKTKSDSGTIILADTGFITLSQSTNTIWQLEITFVVRSIGGVGVASMKTHFVFSYDQDSSDTFISKAIDTLNNTNFDTTIDNEIDITVEWGQTSNNDQINSTVFIYNRMY